MKLSLTEPPKRKLLITAVGVVLLGGVVAGSALALGSAANQPATTGLPPATARVTMTTLVETRTVDGTLGYGDPVPVNATGTGTLTWIAPEGSTVERGEPLFEVGLGSSHDRAGLGFGTSGRVAEISVAVGDSVQAGDALARLQAEALEARLEHARSQLAAAELGLQDVVAGASPEEVEAARAGVASAMSSLASAEARLEALRAGPEAEELVAAQSAADQARANLRAAEARLERAQTGPTDDELLAAQAAFDQAQANLNTARARLEQAQATSAVPADLSAARAALDAAESRLHSAHQALDAIRDELEQARANLAAQQTSLDAARRQADEICDLEGEGSGACAAARARVDAALPPLMAAEAKVKQLEGDESWGMLGAQKEVTSAQAAYAAARDSLERAEAAAAVPADLISAQASYEAALSALESARARLEQVRAGTQPADLAAAEAAVDGARGSLATAEANLRGLQEGATRADLLAAEAAVEMARSNVASAQSTLAQRAGVKESDVALAMESVHQAELSVRQAEIDLEEATLVAPFDGVVAAINARVGEQAPGDFLVLIERAALIDADESEPSGPQPASLASPAEEAMVGRAGNPAVALYGSVPMYRTLHKGLQGPDVWQLEQNLAELGYTGFTVDGVYTSATAEAVRAWQTDLGLPRTGIVEPGQVVFTPGPVRVAEHLARVGDALGGGGGSGASAVPVLSYTSTDRLVTVPLRVADQWLAAEGSTVNVVVPGVGAVEGQVSHVGTVVVEDTVAVTVTIADQQALGSLDVAPVEIEFVSRQRDDVLTVPVAALLALAEGGYGVEVVEGDATRIVPVSTGMFAGGRVEISGEGIAEGMMVGVAR